MNDRIPFIKSKELGKTQSSPKIVYSVSSKADILQIIHAFKSKLSISFSLGPILNIKSGKKSIEILYYQAKGNQVGEQLYLLKNSQETGIVLPSEKKMEFLLIATCNNYFDGSLLLKQLENISEIDAVKPTPKNNLQKKRSALLDVISQNLD